MADFIELSQVSLRKYRYSLGSVDTERYKNTLYVAISENNQVSCAYDPVILKEAYQCILIHCKSKIAITNWHDWYKVEFINHNGINLGEIIGNDCHLKMTGGAGYYGSMTLYHRDEDIYSCREPFEGHMQGLWDAYCSTLNNRKDEIVELKALLGQKEERIQELEEQVCKYKQTLLEIKNSLTDLE